MVSQPSAPAHWNPAPFAQRLSQAPSVPRRKLAGPSKLASVSLPGESPGFEKRKREEAEFRSVEGADEGPTTAKSRPGKKRKLADKKAAPQEKAALRDGAVVEGDQSEYSAVPGAFPDTPNRDGKPHSAPDLRKILKAIKTETPDLEPLIDRLWLQSHCPGPWIEGHKDSYLKELLIDGCRGTLTAEQLDHHQFLVDTTLRLMEEEKSAKSEEEAQKVWTERWVEETSQRVKCMSHNSDSDVPAVHRGMSTPFDNSHSEASEHDVEVIMEEGKAKYTDLELIDDRIWMLRREEPYVEELCVASSSETLTELQKNHFYFLVQTTARLVEEGKKAKTDEQALEIFRKGWKNRIASDDWWVVLGRGGPWACCFYSGSFL